MKHLFAAIVVVKCFQMGHLVYQGPAKADWLTGEWIIPQKGARDQWLEPKACFVVSPEETRLPCEESK